MAKKKAAKKKPAAKKVVKKATKKAAKKAGPIFPVMALIGIGLIGSSIARVARQEKLVGRIQVATRRKETAATARKLKIADDVGTDMAKAVKNADFVVLCTPVGANAEVMATIAPYLKPGAIISDVGSVKQAVIRDIAPRLPKGMHLVPAHPVAGTEHSGPEAGFAELFRGRWCIITPTPETDRAAVAKVAEFWARCGSDVEEMSADHHDKILAITSHLPHLIAYTIVGTATDLEDSIKSEVIKFAAGGFRDFTRIAASDPTMWRDVFLNNREGVLEMLQRLQEDLTVLQRAIRWGEGDKLFDLFTRTRAVRRALIDAKQA